MISGMDELTVEQILTLHTRIMAGDGGDARLLSEPNLHQLVFRANLVPDVFRRAALVLFTLCAYPAFRDGNRRTAHALASRILEQEQYLLAPDDPRVAGLLAGVAAYTVELEEIEQWLRTNVKKE
jgi:prophage maintenance system killer protein